MSVLLLADRESSVQHPDDGRENILLIPNPALGR